MSSLVKDVFAHIKKNKLNLSSLSAKAGISYSSARSWKRHEPQLGNFVSLVEAMGGEITINWKEDKNK
mgnify:FL=1